jgi:hypothetical protein
VRNGDLFTIHINVFNDTGALDNLLCEASLAAFISPC